jgi:signal transduction histidine kinase
MILLVLFGFTTLFIQYTNFNGLFYKSYALIYDGNFAIANFTHGIWYWIHQVVVNFMLLISSILYLNRVLESSGKNRIRASIMLISCTIPWGMYLIYLTGHSPHNFDLSPFSFSLVGFLAALGIFRFQLLEFVPVALEHVFNSMTDGVIIIDKHHRLVSYNQSSSRLFPELTARMKWEPLDVFIAGLSSLSDHSDGSETDIELQHPDGMAYYHVRMVPIKNDRNKSKGWALIFTNVTERHLKEKGLVEKEKYLKELNDIKDKFLAIIGHDLRNSFHLIINMAEMLVANLEKDNKEGAIKKGKIIHDTSITTYNLLQNLLEWALIQQKGMQFNPVNLKVKPLIDEEIRNIRMLCEQKNLTVTHTVDSALAVKADAEMLKTVIRNLITNAIKYSFPGGNILITDSFELGFVTIAITDKGIGMTPEEQVLVFGPSGNLSKKGTASENGTGLGLRLCREFINLHGGKIWVNSSPGEGSTFSFTIPVAV